MKKDSPGGVLHARRVTQLVRRWRCLDDAELAAYVDGRLEADARERVQKHLADCDHCLSHVGALLRAQEAEPTGEVPPSLFRQAQELVPQKPRRVSSPVWGWASVAAAAACLVIVLAQQVQQPQVLPAPAPPRVAPALRTSPPPLTTSKPLSASPGAVRTLRKNEELPQLVFPPNGARVPEDQMEFRWKGPRESVTYELRLATANGDLVWEGNSESEQLRLPPEVVLAPGTRYFVWVLAHLPDGKTLKSKAIAFRVTPRR